MNIAEEQRCFRDYLNGLNVKSSRHPSRSEPVSPNQVTKERKIPWLLRKCIYSPR